MSTTDTRAAFEAWMQTRPGYPFAGSFANLMWASWQAATEAAKPAQEEDSQIRWCADGQIFGLPTATDALEYAEQRLRDPEEMICCKSDSRLDSMPNIRDLLSAAKATGTEGEQTKQSFENIEELPLPPYVKYALHCLAGEEAKAEAERQMREYGQQCAKTAMAKVYAIAVQEKAKMDAEAARQPAPVVAVKTWHDRLNSMHSEDGHYGYVQMIQARDAEIADLRAALAARSQP